MLEILVDGDREVPLCVLRLYCTPAYTGVPDCVASCEVRTTKHAVPYEEGVGAGSIFGIADGQTLKMLSGRPPKYNII